MYALGWNSSAIVSYIAPSNSCEAVFYFKSKKKPPNICPGLVGSTMCGKTFLWFVSFLALVALKCFFLYVFLHVSLQSKRSDASIVALVTFERLFSSMLHHDMIFQMTSVNARKLAHCASMWLFSRVRPLVLLQVAWCCCFIFALIALV